MKFIYNDGGRSKYFKATNVGDCAIRAIAIATGIDYKQVYNDLKKLNNGTSCRNGTPKKVDKTYLTQLGWVWTPTMFIGQGCKVHLDEDELPSGTLIVSVSGHLTCVKDGVVYDTYDCTREGNRCVYGYWRKPTKEEVELKKKQNEELALKKKKEAEKKAKIKKIKEKYNKKIKALETALNKEIKALEKQYN